MEDNLDNRKSCSIIIVTYNSVSYISDCLNPLVDMSEVEVVVVDNDSRDGTVTKLREDFPAVQLITLPENIGFGRACNIGVSVSNGSFIVLLNPDAIASAQAVKTLIRFFDGHPRTGIVGGCLVDLSGLPLQSMGDRPTLVRLMVEKPIEWVAQRVDPHGPFRHVLGRYFAKLRTPSAAEQVAWVSGAALCCRRRTWEDVGGFDEKFFLYYEDVDLCLRATQGGWEVWYVPHAVIPHQSGASFSGNVYYQKYIYYENQRYFFQKHYGPVSAFLLSLAQKIYGWRHSWKNSFV
jgi:GT2 family glycosyltransferase